MKVSTMTKVNVSVKSNFSVKSNAQVRFKINFKAEMGGTNSDSQVRGRICLWVSVRVRKRQWPMQCYSRITGRVGQGQVQCQVDVSGSSLRSCSGSW